MLCKNSNILIACHTCNLEWHADREIRRARTTTTIKGVVARVGARRADAERKLGRVKTLFFFQALYLFRLFSLFQFLVLQIDHLIRLRPAQRRRKSQNRLKI